MHTKSLKIKLGFTLIEVGIAAAIAGMAATGALYYQAQEMQYRVARSQVDQLKVLNAAVVTYESKYFSSLINDEVVVGVASAYTPTVPELKGLGLLDAGFSDKNFYPTGGVGTYRIRLTKNPLFCAPIDCVACFIIPKQLCV